ncbi:MAG: aldo/keto reductase, partial [Eubacteriaceae bacterium]
MKSYKLNNGVDIPLIGLGTYPMNGKTLLLTTIHALRLGYTYFDTASAYSNEKYLGYGLKLTFKKRKDIFISTKLSNDQQREGNVKAALINSLSALKVDYVDLYLIHWPVPETYIDSWKQMEHLYEMGYARAIGVCN